MDMEQRDLIELSDRELDLVAAAGGCGCDGENNGNQNSPGGIAVGNGTDVTVIVYL